MKKFICVHGHFYQPPRENPWLEAVELQDSAYPFHDWNERIVAECYGPNAHARLLDGEGRIRQIVSNYDKISFNFGPTLLSWMKEKAPDIHQAIIEADKESRQRFGGHGSALAQCYNHVIMPLANQRDKRTQVLWGLQDFEYRFGRKAEGMWLPECAADNDSLEALAEFGVRFTILSPFQASRVRALRGGVWRDVNGGRFDPTRPYVVKLPSGRSITVFFYDGPISRAIAFEQLLTNGERFAHRLTDAFDDGRKHDQLVHVATDGESYGHHFRYGEMALAYALHHIESKQLARLTNYGQFLASHPPTHEAQIHQPSAWSCCHGVGRWYRDCGCNSGGRSNWNQQWRQPLRDALDWLRDQLAPLFEKQAGELLNKPWQARDNYIAVILNRLPENRAQFFARHASRQLNEAEQVTALRLLELQRHAMLMYTSCGWFFDELSGIETVQVIQYAARALQLAKNVLATDLESGFLDRLAAARSNIGEFGDGRKIYERFAKPAVMDREKVGAHYAVSSLFESYAEQARIYSFTIGQEDRQLWSAGKARLVVGRVKVTFEITCNSDIITYGVLHLGEHNLNCGVRHYQGPDAYQSLVAEMREAFDRADFAAIIRLMDRHFGESNYSLRHLFKDEQRKVLREILTAVHEDVYSTYRLITDRYAPLLRFLADLPAPAPPALQMAFQSVLNSELRTQLEGNAVDAERVRCLLQEAQRNHVPLDVDGLGYAMKGQMEGRANDLVNCPEDQVVLERFLTAAELLPALPFEANLWRPQNTYWILLNNVLPSVRERARKGDDAAIIWLDKFLQLGSQLRFRIEPTSGECAS